MPKKQSTRNSNNTSINTSNTTSSTANNNTSNNEAGNEDKDRKHKNNPYYSWWQIYETIIREKYDYNVAI